MRLLGGCVSSVWLIHDVELAKQIQLGLQLLPGASGDVLEILNIDGNIDATFVLLQRWTHLLKVITNAKYEARPFIILSSRASTHQSVAEEAMQRFCRCTAFLICTYFYHGHWFKNKKREHLHHSVTLMITQPYSQDIYLCSRNTNFDIPP